MKIKYLFVILSALILILSLESVVAQTNTPPPTLGTAIGNALSLRNPAIQQTNDFTIQLGDGIRTERSETFQATVIHGLYAVKDNLSLGGRFELDTLGTGGNTISGLSLGGEVRYETDNLYVSGLAGYHKDVELNKRAFEFGIGLGVYVTPSFSTSIEYLLNLKSTTDNNSMDRAIVATANWTF